MENQPIADRFRRWGYLQAALDPLGRLQPMPLADLDEVPPEAAAPWRAIYCGAIGAEFMHIPAPERRRWMAESMEAAPPAVDTQRILERLAGAELFERFLHARYVGSKRYSLEGAAALVPLLDAVLDTAAEHGVEIALLGMSHRGRLTVMTQVVGTPLHKIFAGYEDFEPRSVLGSGDVKYHLGATGTYTAASGLRLATHLVSNPSHLEAVNPVLLGRLRARQRRLGEDGRRRVLGINVHGDAAFAGQGIAAEALNLTDLPGYTTGGCIHVVVNNLIGFTTEPVSLHSSRYATDIAKRNAIPILHVDGTDLEAVWRVGCLASAYRAAFHSDVVVDLIGFRRYGHSEVDDPTITQPLLYHRIDKLPMLWQDHARRCGVPVAEQAALQERIQEQLAREQEAGRGLAKKPVLRQLPAWWDAYHGGAWDASAEPQTAVAPDRLAALGERLAQVPAGFEVHPKLRKLLQQRLEMCRGARPVDWGTAEALAFATLIDVGVPVRLSGQDSRRGTFNHRHAALIDHDNGREHVPLQHLRDGQAWFEVWDSPLSEAAILGFEYGFSRDYPDALVLWEAQFGDFVNGAQVVLDQFLSAGEDKWHLLSGLVLLLPHGYEGQGPEHSSARLERFLQLAGEDNWQVCQPTTAAQYFHLLRRQALGAWRKPLVVPAPKGFLRAAAAASPCSDLAGGRFQPVLGEEGGAGGGARRVLVGSGKIVHELRAERARRARHDVAILSLEQIFPFPRAAFETALAQHPAAEEIVWVQEEPANMGALSFVRPLLQAAGGGRHLRTVKRSASASPATGSPKAHALEQSTLWELAFS